MVSHTKAFKPDKEQWVASKELALSLLERVNVGITAPDGNTIESVFVKSVFVYSYISIC